MTMIEIMQNPKLPRMIGDDRIMRRGAQLTIRSRVDMHEWQIQENRKTVIFINDEAWCLVGKQYTAAKEVHYILDPWPEHLYQIAGRRIRYDDEYVRARNEAEKKRKIEAVFGPVLFHLRGLIGFLPSRLKHCIEEKFGVPARNATFISIIVELFLFFVLGACLQIFTYGSMRLPELVVYVPMLILLVITTFVDLVLRYDSYIREDASPWGVFEWVFKLHRTGVLMQGSGKPGIFALFKRICKQLVGGKK